MRKDVNDMFEIKGKVTTAICYAKVIEDEAIEQIRRMCDYDLTRGSKVRIMPDVHAGKGCTIGTTMTITDKICPNIVGVDIGCGMYTVKLQNQVIDFEKIDEACHYIPSGMNVWEGRMERFDLTQLKCYRSLKDAKRLERSLGTLGGGNHFIEVDRAKDGTYYLVIHSGSRNLGKQVAEIYQQLAIDLHAGKEEYFKKREEIIRTYKEQGRRAEIQEALKYLKKNYEIQELDAPNDICWLYGSFMDDYLHDVEICQRFARRSRERMAEIIIERTKMTRTEAFHTIHNYIDSTLFPSDIVHKYYQASSKRRCELGNFDDTLEGLWNSLPNFIEGDNSTLVVRDGSGSMDTTVGNTNVTALEVSTALAIYFSEHLTGHFYNKFITFSSRPAMIDMSNATCVRDKLEICEAHSDCSNTDLKAVFDLILNTAVENKLNQSELPKNILIVSDMEFDSMMGTYSRWGSYNQDDSSTKTLLESIAAEYQAYGYTLPRLIFWNVCSRTNTIMLQENEAGVALVSGFNPAVYNMVLSNELDPYKCLLKQINSERYDAIENILCA